MATDNTETELPVPVFKKGGEIFNWPSWIGKTIALEIESPAADLDLVVNIQCAQKELYKYFPFLVWVYLDEKPIQIVEFSKEYENLNFDIPVEAAGAHVLRFDCELTGCPKALGISEDVRHLSIQLNRASWRTARRTRVPPATTERFFQTKYEALSDHTAINPVFVIGAYRSGTSISTWILGQHPNIMPVEENTFLIMKYYSAIANYRINTQAKENFADIYDISLREFLLAEGESFHAFCTRSAKQRTFHTFLESIHLGHSAYKPGFSLIRGAYNPKSRWVNGTPEYSMIAPGLKDMFPNAKMIFMLRHPRDVISSLMRFDALGERARAYGEAASAWERLTYRAYEAYTNYGRETVFLSDYRRLRNEPAALIRDWWDFLGEPYFDKAVQTTAQTINSSGPEEEEIEFDGASLRRLEVLYEGILAGVPIENLPWRADFPAFDKTRGNLVNQFVGLIS
jgi:hypothetical protein